MPEAQTGFVGIARNEETHQPMPYMESLPESLAGRPVFVLDPMLATGGSMAHTIGLLVERGASDVTAICVLAAPEGIARLRRERAAGAGRHRVRRRAAQRLGLHRARPRRRGRPPLRRASEGARPSPRAAARTASSHRSSALGGRNPRSCSADPAVHGRPQGERHERGVGVGAQRLLLDGPLDGRAQRPERGARDRAARRLGRQQRGPGEHEREQVRVVERAVAVGEGGAHEVVERVRRSGAACRSAARAARTPRRTTP